MRRKSIRRKSIRRKSIRSTRKRIRTTNIPSKKNNIPKIKFFMISYQGNADFAKVTQKVLKQIWGYS